MGHPKRDAVPLCVLCVGEPDGCLRCHGTGIDPDPLAPVLEAAL